MGKKILITGVAGMIGSHLLDELLIKGYQVIGIDNFSVGKLENINQQLSNSNFKFSRVDILDYESLKILAKDTDAIVHLAAVKKIGEKQSGMDTLKVNTKGTEYIFEIAKMWGCKVIFASTSDIYGMSTELPFKEDGDSLIGPSMIKRWGYAVSKLYGEQLVYAYYQDYGVPCVILRYFGGFSPRAAFSWSGGHIPIFIDAILQNKEVIIHGDGTQTRSMAYVSDLVNGTILALENEKAVGEVFNIGNDEEMRVIDTAHLISELANTGQPLKTKFIPFSGVFGRYKDIMRRVPDLTKAKQVLNYSPKIKLKEAIRLTIEERKKYLNI
ncbi:NAD-dependent epimerase/dehydratase family protein [Planctomycetota bacterium]